MMEYISTISYFLTNEMRLFLGLFLVAKVMNFRPKRMLLLLSAAGGVLVTALQMAGLPTIGVLTVELLVITAVTWYCLRDKLNLCLFLIFFMKSVSGYGISCCKRVWASCSIRKILSIQMLWNTLPVFGWYVF